MLGPLKPVRDVKSHFSHPHSTPPPTCHSRQVKTTGRTQNQLHPAAQPATDPSSRRPQCVQSHWVKRKRQRTQTVRHGDAPECHSTEPTTAGYLLHHPHDAPTISQKKYRANRP